MTEAFAWPSSFLRRHASFYHFFWLLAAVANSVCFGSFFYVPLNDWMTNRFDRLLNYIKNNTVKWFVRLSLCCRIYKIFDNIFLSHKSVNNIFVFQLSERA
jgi:hypothetical protein